MLTRSEEKSASKVHDNVTDPINKVSGVKTSKSKKIIDKTSIRPCDSKISPDNEIISSDAGLLKVISTETLPFPRIFRMSPTDPSRNR
jgi:hypothetical protein